MIKSFKCAETEKIWEGNFSKKLPPDIQHIVLRKLRMINNAHDLNDLRVPPANRLEALKGDLLNKYSIRVNSRWRLCFSWIKGEAFEIEMIDYH